MTMVGPARASRYHRPAARRRVTEHRYVPGRAAPDAACAAGPCRTD